MPSQSPRLVPDSVTVATLGLLAIAVLFGGASRLNELRLALVEVAALPVFVLLAWRFTDWARLQTKLSWQVLAAVLAVPVLQLIPLPPDLWGAFPGRSDANLALELTSLPAQWIPLSLTPDKTWRSFLALLPPAAMFLAVFLTTSQHRLRLVHALLGATVLSVILGAAQLVGGEGLYLWPTTDAGTVVGFFANRNHLATLCLIAIPFASVLGGRALRHQGRDHRMVLWLSALFLGLMVLALGVIRSRMGIVLLAPISGFSLFAAWIASGGGRPKPLLLTLAGASIVGFAAVAIFSLGPLLERFDTGTVREGRFENWPIVAEAAGTYLPMGSGIGSFDAVFRSVEPIETLDSTFFNQAHNDYLESWLETGWLGASVLIAFLTWFARRSWTAWRSRPAVDRDLQRAASIAIVVVLLHSFVDYPLRTETIAVVFALCAAILEMAAKSDDQVAIREPSRRRQRA